MEALKAFQRRRTYFLKNFNRRIVIAFVLTFAGFSYLQTTNYSDEKKKLSSKEKLNHTFEERRLRLNSICKKYQNSIRVEHQSLFHLPIDEPRFYSTLRPKVSMCMIPKVASTSLSSFLVTAHRDTFGEEGLENLMKPIPFVPHLNESFRLLVVRHPMERLLSAFLYIFRHEIKIDRNGTSLFSELSRKLVMKYRELPLIKPADIKLPENFLTFPEFIRYVLRGGVDFPDEDDPTIRDDNLNGHWLPFWKLCTPCRPESMPHLIVKMGSSIGEEMKQAMEISKLSEVIHLDKLPWLNPTLDNSKSKFKIYFSQLTKKDVENLFFKFRIDHELFDYGTEPFLSFAKASENTS